MASKAETDHAATIEQITANIERAVSLAEAENVDGLEELNKETEALISGLPTRGKTPDGDFTWAGYKKAARDDMRKASQAQPKPEPKEAPKAEVVTIAYTDFEGVEELVTLGAEKVAEGVRLHLRTSEVAKEIATVALDICMRIPNKDGNPDIMLTSQQARDAMSDLYAKAGEGFERNEANEKALKSLQRSVQYYRNDNRAELLRSLDDDSSDTADERQAFAAILADKPEDVAASEYVAEKYGTTVQPKEELATGDTTDAKIRTVVKKFRADLSKVSVDDFEKANDETKEAIRAELEEAYEALKKMIAATL